MTPDSMEPIASYQAPTQAAAPETPAPEATPPPAPEAASEPEFLTVARELEQARAELAQLRAQQATETPAPRHEVIQNTLAELAKIRVGFDHDPGVQKAVYEQFGLTEDIPPRLREMYARNAITSRELELKQELLTEQMEQRYAELRRQAVEEPQVRAQQNDIIGTLKRYNAADEFHLRLVVPHYQTAIASGLTHEQGLRMMESVLFTIRGNQAAQTTPTPAPAPTPAPKVSALAQLQAARGGSAPTTQKDPAAALGAFFKQFR